MIDVQKRREKMSIKAINLAMTLTVMANVAWAQAPLPNFREPPENQRTTYHSPSGRYLGESVNRNGVTTHRNSVGATVYITRCSGRTCTMRRPSGEIVQTWIKRN
jgi:hypothetical protein